jgi:hypothetical protein
VNGTGRGDGPRWLDRAERAADRLAGCYPGTGPDPGEDLVRATAFLGSSLSPRTVVEAGYVAGAAAFPALFVAILAAGPASLAGLAATGGAFAVVHGIHRVPVLLARVRRTRALGAASGLLGRAVLRMRLDPSLERAVAFAARSGDGPLAASLAGHVRRAEGTPDSGLDGFASEWSETFPALDRATALLVSSATAPSGERERSLDRALEAVLEGSRDELAAFAGRVRGPVTALYAFGVLLPLALVGVVPAARVAGVDGLTVGSFVLVYDVLLPAGLLAAGLSLLVRRPVAFPPPAVPTTHPDVPDRTWPERIAGLGAAALGWFGANAAIARWAAPTAAVGAGVGAWLVVRYRPVTRVRERVRAVESGLPDALYLIGRRVSEGVAVEAALDRAAEEAPGATGAVLGDAVRVARGLRVDVHSAFLGDCGALGDVPSPRARGTARLLALAATEGRPAGETLVAAADQLDELRRIEREARRELASVTGTLANTAAVFAPLVGGATVALAGTMANHGGGAGSGPGPPGSVSAASTATTGTAEATGSAALAVADLGPAVFTYVILLAAVLTALSVGLERGLDAALVGYRVGLALLSATATFLAAVVGAGLLA